jgi:hypothetical protein
MDAMHLHATLPVGDIDLTLRAQGPARPDLGPAGAGLVSGSCPAAPATIFSKLFAVCMSQRVGLSRLGFRRQNTPSQARSWS